MGIRCGSGSSSSRLGSTCAARCCGGPPLLLGAAAQPPPRSRPAGVEVVAEAVRAGGAAGAACGEKVRGAAARRGESAGGEEPGDGLERPVCIGSAPTAVGGGAAARLGVGGAMLDVVDAHGLPGHWRSRGVRSAIVTERGHSCKGSKEADAVVGVGVAVIQHPPHEWMREREGEDQHAVERFYPRDLRCLAAERSRCREGAVQPRDKQPNLGL